MSDKLTDSQKVNAAGQMLRGAFDRGVDAGRKLAEAEQFRRDQLREVDRDFVELRGWLTAAAPKEEG